MYYLSKHIFVCPSGDQVVLLDIKHDRYMALDRKQAGLLAGFLQGQPATNAHMNCATEEVDSFARFMNEKELLTTNKGLGKIASSPMIYPPSNGLFEKEISSPPKVRIRHVAALLGSAAFSAAVLRWRSIEHVVTSVTHRRSVRCSDSAAPDLQIARSLVSVFYRLRPFIFRTNNACLFDSLTLINFLARFGVFPQWVFGVRTDPFAAHCWVQQDGTVFNDSIEHVTRYTPIMVA